MNDEADDIEANRFAMELLIPYDWILADIEALGGVDVEDDRAIRQLAKKYRVSVQVMTLRIAGILNEWKVGT